MLAKLRGRVRIAALGLALVACNSDRLVAPAPGATKVDLSVAPMAAIGAAGLPPVVISQVYGGGGNSGATLKNDFIELYNPGVEAVDVTGWSVNYASSTGSSWQKTSLAGIIPPGGYYLVQEAAGSGGTVNLPTPDASGGISMSGSAGKVVLASPGMTVSGTCPTGVDQVGFGGSTLPDTTTGLCKPAWGRTANLGNTTAAIRTVKPCTSYTGTAADFSVLTATPRNSKTAAQPCGPQVQLSPRTLSLTLGDGYALRAAGFDAAGTPLAGFSWATSDGSVATVVDGVVTTHQVGVATITATSGSISGQATLTVTKAVGSVLLSPDDADVTVGKTQQLLVTLLDTDGTELSPAPAVTWTSSDPAVASVSASGLVSGLKAGVATITATAGGKSATATITVATGAAGVVASVWVTSNTDGDANANTVPAGYARKYFASARDAFNKTIPGVTFTWTPNAPELAVSATASTTTGYAIGSKPGKYSFTVTAPNGVSWTKSLTVVDSAEAGTAEYANQVELGVPSDGDASDEFLITTGPAARRAALSYSATRGGPNWVSWTITKSQFGDAPRCDCWSEDPRLPGSVYRVTDDDYTGGGYDRGHMVQSESRTASDGENAATFLTTNALPQAGQNNQGPWGQFENYLNDLARRSTDRKDVYVVAGGIWAANAPTLKNAGRVAIPDYTWKVAVIVNAGVRLADIRSLQDLEVIAVKMPNRLDSLTPMPPETDARRIRNVPWSTFRVTVDQLEAATRYDVLDLLADEIEAPVEAGDVHAPTIALPATATALEGTPLTLDASQSRDEDGDALTYTWTVGSDTVATGATPTLTFPDDGTKVVTLTLRDSYGAAARQSVTITVQNAAPVATLGSGTLSVVSGGTLQVTGGFTDAGVQDAPWQWAIDFGNGITRSGSATAIAPVAGSATYLQAGSYTVTFQVTDKDGATGTATPLVITVERLAAAGAVSPQVINANATGGGNVAFALLSQAGLDATTLDVGSARIGEVAPILKNKGEWFTESRDVNGDGAADLVVRFDRGELVRAGALVNGQPSLVMTGTLRDGRQVKATGEVTVR